jgi:hypothetical protein
MWLCIFIEASSFQPAEAPCRSVKRKLILETYRSRKMSSIFAAVHRDDVGSFEYLFGKHGADPSSLAAIIDEFGRSRTVFHPASL